jgi:hypothetical protein
MAFLTRFSQLSTRVSHHTRTFLSQQVRLQAAQQQNSQLSSTGALILSVPDIDSLCNKVCIVFSYAFLTHQNTFLLALRTFLTTDRVVQAAQQQR